MRRYRFLLALSLAWLCLPAWAAPRAGLGWSLDAMHVEGRGDSLAVRLVWTIRDWNVDASKAVVFAPAVRNGGHVVNLRPLVVYGSKCARTADRIVASGNSEEARVVDVPYPLSVVTEDVFPRREWMDTVKVTLAVSDWSKRSGLVLKSTSQRGIFVRPAEPPAPVFGWTPLKPRPDRTEVREVVLSAPVTFAAGSTKFDLSLMRGEDAEALRVFLGKLKTLTSTRRFKVVSSELAVTLAPSGDEKNAMKLSKGRTASLFTYLQRGGAFRVSVPARVPGGEDWDGVRDWVSRSSFASDERLMEILSLNLGSDYKYETVSREKPAAMEELVKSCFPKLYRVYYEARISHADYMDGKFVRPVYEEMPEVLSAWDFWLLSTSYAREDPRWLDCMLDGALMHPEDERLNYNAAMALIDRGELAEASVFLRNVPLSSDDGKYAHSVWLFRSGWYDEALECLEFLSGRSAFYASVWEQTEPFVRWYTCRQPWMRLHL